MTGFGIQGSREPALIHTGLEHGDKLRSSDQS